TAAGNAAYFSRRRAIDLLGKNDAHIAHLPPRVAGWPGHSKFDMSYSLAKNPDVLVTIFPNDFRTDQELRAHQDYASALLTNPLFVEHYRSQPSRIEYFRKNGMVYVRDGSPELSGLERWQLPAVTQ